MGVGEKKTPESFRNSCDEFVFLENLSGEIKEEIDDNKSDVKGETNSDNTENDSEQDESIEVVHNLLKIASDNYQDDEGYVNISSAGQFIKRVKPDFDVRTFGFVKLPKLIEAYPEKYEMKRYQGKGTVTIVAYRCKENM